MLRSFAHDSKSSDPDPQFPEQAPVDSICPRNWSPIGTPKRSTSRLRRSPLPSGAHCDGRISRHSASYRAIRADGLLLFGREQLSRHPDAWIQAGRFAGKDQTELVDRANLTDYQMIALEQALSFVRNTRLGTSIGRVRCP